MKDIFAKWEFVHRGVRFEARTYPDYEAAPPWVRGDWHGPVRSAHDAAEKRPGERVLHRLNGHSIWLYDWQAACKLARTEDWDAEPHGAPNRIERAVQADFDYLRGWAKGDWEYVGVSVVRLGQDDEFEHALWGVESSDTAYLRTVATELADDAIYPLVEAWKERLAAGRIAHNWARLAAVQAAVLQPST